MEHGFTRKRKVRPQGFAICECCGLRAPRAELAPWLQRAKCQELTLQDPDRRPARKPEEEWVTGVYRHFYVTHEFQVCPSCFDYLLDGGEFASFFRHRGKIGFLILATVVVTLIILLPELLPLMRSAFWQQPAEN